MVVTQRTPPNHATSRKQNNKSTHVRPAANKKAHQAKQKDTFKYTDDIISTGDFINGIYVESSPTSSVVNQVTSQQITNASPVRPTTSQHLNLHTNSTPLVNNMGPRPNLYYTPAPVHYRNFSTPAVFPATAPPIIPIPSSLAKPIPFPMKDELTLLAPSKITKQSSPSLPISTRSATKPGYYSVDELEQFNNSPSKKSESFELGTSPGSSPPVSSSAPKRLQNAAGKPNTRYYSDGNYANAPHPSDLPRPQFS